MLNRSVPPPFQNNSSFSLISPEKILLPNGLTLCIINGGEQDVVKIEIVVKAGKWQEQQTGVAYFTAHLLQKGTATKNSYQISQEFDQQGIHLEVNPGHDFISIGMYGLTRNTGLLFNTFFEILTAPSFPEVELQLSKDIYIQGLKINLEKTSYLASRLLRKNLFPGNHPYGRDAEVADIEAITQQHLQQFHQNFFTDIEIFCSGKITPEIKEQLVALFQKFQVVHPAETTPRPISETATWEFQKKENSVQSSIRLGKHIIPRLHPDYPSSLLLNHILGGYFGSRLMKNIREEKGLTYGIYSSVAALKYNSYLSIGTDVNLENRDFAIEEIKNELRALRTNRIPTVELETARNHFIGSLQAEITTPFAHADKIKTIRLYGLPDDYYHNILQKIEKLDRNQLLETAQQYFNEESFSVVAVG